jgi:hypothetical protein
MLKPQLNSGVLGFFALSIVQYFVEYNISETGSVSFLRRRDGRLTMLYPLDHVDCKFKNNIFGKYVLFG